MFYYNQDDLSILNLTQYERLYVGKNYRDDNYAVYASPTKHTSRLEMLYHHKEEKECQQFLETLVSKMKDGELLITQNEVQVEMSDTSDYDV